MELKISSIEELGKVCEALGQFVSTNKIIAFYGEMGAGKTTFIKRFIEYLGGEETDSPTFSLVNECDLANGEKAFHFDFYRINSEEEAMDMGVEEYLYSGYYCLIEWPQKIENLLPENYVSVHIKELNGTRIFKIQYN